MSPTLATTDPAIAVAMARCLAARSLDPARPVTRQHDRRCGWCDWPVDELRVGVEAFNAWAGFDDRANTTRHHKTRVFAELPRDRREELIVAAQAFPPAKETSEEPEAPKQPDQVEEEVSPWRQ